MRSEWVGIFVNSVLFAAAIAFLAPQSGSQAIGPQLIEISTTIASVDRVEFYVDGALAGVARKPPFRIAHDFGTSLAAHEIEAKVYSDRWEWEKAGRELLDAKRHTPELERARINEALGYELIGDREKAHDVATARSGR